MAAGSHYVESFDRKAELQIFCQYNISPNEKWVIADQC